MLISVILTTYNSGVDVLKCIDSILNQEGVNHLFEIELVIIDDHSSDNTVSLLENKGLTVYATEENSGGPNRGRNIGLKKITGSWVIIADHDDLWHKDRIRSLLPFLHDEDIILSSGYRVVDKTKQRTFDVLTKGKGSVISFSKNETFLKLISKNKNNKQITYLGALMIRNSGHLPQFEEKFGVVDFDWIAKIFKDKRGIQLNSALYTRIQDHNNLSRNESYRLKDYELTKAYLECLPSHLNKYREKGIKGINGTLARYYYVKGEMRKSRKYFRLSSKNLITLFYYLTSFIGSRFVIANFKVFD